jgi:hypothetical protein
MSLNLSLMTGCLCKHDNVCEKCKLVDDTMIMRNDLNELELFHMFVDISYDFVNIISDTLS